MFKVFNYTGWSWESLREWWQFLKLGLPGIAMISIEWISYEIGAFVVGTIDEVQLALNAFIINVLTLVYMVSKQVYFFKLSTV